MITFRALVAATLLAVGSFHPLREGFIALHQWRIGKPPIFVVADEFNAAVVAFIIGVLVFIEIMRNRKKEAKD